MLASILKSQSLIGLFFAYLYSAGCLFFLLFQFGSNQNYDLLYSHWAFSWAQDQSYLLSIISTLVFAAAAIFARVRSGETRKLITSGNLTMVLFSAFVLTQSSSVFARVDVTVAMFTSILMLLLIQRVAKSESVGTELFHSGMLLGGSTLFVGQAIVLTVPVIVAFSIFRTRNWREWTVLVLGVVMSALFLVMVAIWFPDPVTEFQRVIQSGWTGSFSITTPNLGHLFLLPVILVTLGSMFIETTTGTISERNHSVTQITWILAVLAMVLLLGLGWQEGLLMAGFSIVISATKALQKIERWWLADLILACTLAAPFLSNLWRL